MAYYQISSGDGPLECELAVEKFLKYINSNYNDIQLIDYRCGSKDSIFKSVCIATNYDLDKFCGTIKWICKSPFRPNHKRKNWFINVKKFDETQLVDFDESQVKYSTMRSGGNGGQNVNKVETAVRAIYLPTGFTTVCSDERSQYMNKKRALERIKFHLLEVQDKVVADNKKNMWQQHNNLIRGNELITFVGEDFQLK